MRSFYQYCSLPNSKFWFRPYGPESIVSVEGFAFVHMASLFEFRESGERLTSRRYKLPRVVTDPTSLQDITVLDVELCSACSTDEEVVGVRVHQVGWWSRAVFMEWLFEYVVGNTGS